MKMTKTELLEFLREWEENESCDARANHLEDRGKAAAAVNSSKIAMAIGLLESTTPSGNIQR